MRKRLLTALCALIVATCWSLGLLAGPAGAASVASPPGGARAARAGCPPPGCHRRARVLRGGVFDYEPAAGGHLPVLAVVGASFSVGVGAGRAGLAWPEDLARLVHWRLVVAADPGAGFLNRGTGRLGPFSRLLARLHLARLRPRLVIVQGGHNDIGWPLRQVRERAGQLVRSIERQAPAAEIAVVSVFSARLHPRRREWAVDRAVLAGALAADRQVIVFNPLEARWRYPRRPGHFHPTRQGYLWLARRLRRRLAGDGLFSRPPASALFGLLGPLVPR